MARLRGPETRSVKPGEMPPELAMGPCIEVWAADYAPPPWGDDVIPKRFRLAHYARRQWRAAGDAWAASTGMDKPFNWPNLARTRHPWSREYLIQQGRGDLADYYENGGDHPGRSWEK